MYSLTDSEDSEGQRVRLVTILACAFGANICTSDAANWLRF